MPRMLAQSLGELVLTEGLAMRVVEALEPGRPEYTYVAQG
jgi:DNA-binding HxlR family transcriptional regulator